MTLAPHILVIEDTPSVARVMSRYLEHRGLRVTCIGTAEAALDLLARDDFAAVLLDDSLPGMMGIQALPRIREISRVPILFITGYPHEQLASDAVALGADAFISKAVPMDELHRILIGVLKGRRPASG